MYCRHRGNVGDGVGFMGDTGEHIGINSVGKGGVLGWGRAVLVNHMTCFISALTPLGKVATWTWSYIGRAFERHRPITLMVLFYWPA